jgi:hypothetical protein
MSAFRASGLARTFSDRFQNPRPQTSRDRAIGQRHTHGGGDPADIRPDVIARARQRLASGFYDEQLPAHMVADKLARVLTP